MLLISYGYLNHCVPVFVCIGHWHPNKRLRTTHYLCPRLYLPKVSPKSSRSPLTRKLALILEISEAINDPEESFRKRGRKRARFPCLLPCNTIGYLERVVYFSYTTKVYLTTQDFLDVCTLTVPSTRSISLLLHLGHFSLCLSCSFNDSIMSKL